MKKYLFIALAVIILGFSAYYAFVYYASYSQGYRAGELVKFSKKGVLIKTWEGQINQGVADSQIFHFSVEDKDTAVIRKLIDLQGHSVKLTYKERYRTFPWWGDTRYFVINVEQTGD